nr:hypothetical protein [uncultured Jannaschia sp.]
MAHRLEIDAGLFDLSEEMSDFIAAFGGCIDLEVSARDSAYGVDRLIQAAVQGLGKDQPEANGKKERDKRDKEGPAGKCHPFADELRLADADIENAVDISGRVPDRKIDGVIIRAENVGLSPERGSRRDDWMNRALRAEHRTDSPVSVGFDDVRAAPNEFALCPVPNEDGRGLASELTDEVDQGMLRKVRCLAPRQ